MPLPTDNQSRKERPIARGVLDYFPDAIAEVAHVSFIGNRQHNPGEEMHWAREKSKDHADCIVRHLLERGTLDTDGMRHSAKIAWRALAMLQLEIEADAAKQPHFQGVPINQVTQLDPPRKPEQRADLLLGPAQTTIHIDDIPDGTVLAIESPGAMPMFYNGMRIDHSPRTTRTVYIAGPMRGYDKFNFPAFDAARDRFVNDGWMVINPADLDRKNHVHEDTVVEQNPASYRVFAKRDSEALLSMKAERGDAIAMLPGWEKSTGAFAELAFARWLGLKVLDAETMKPLNHARMGDVTRSLAQFLDKQG